MEMKAYTYITINKINGRLYIGVHGATEFDTNYKGSGKLIIQAFDKYGWENFVTYMIKAFDNLEEALDHEEYLIGKYNAVEDPKFYNLACGGRNGYGYWTGLNKGTHWIHNPETGQKRMVFQDEFEELLDQGWIPGSKAETDEPTICVNNGIRNRYVTLEEFELLKDEGYVLGSKPKVFKDDYVGPNNGNIGVHKGQEYHMVSPSELSHYINDLGFKIGLPDGCRVHRTCVHKGNDVRWVTDDELELFIDNGYVIGKFDYLMTNGEEVITVQKDEIEEFSLRGYIVIETRKPTRHTGQICVTNGTETYRISSDDLPRWLSLGFHRGNAFNVIHDQGKRMGEANKGKIFVTNGLINMKIDPEELPELEAKGFHRGFYRKKTLEENRRKLLQKTSQIAGTSSDEDNQQPS